ncbi:MAG: hypothetical protein O2794_02060 [bacterium]|nr:hypothetical protein [bacterium]
MPWDRRHIVSAGDFTHRDLIEIFEKTAYIKGAMKSPLGKRQLGEVLKHDDSSPYRVKLHFDEPSTRTHDSFLEAVDFLGGKWRSNTHAEKTSSRAKGESYEDTILMALRYDYDICILRHEGSEPNVMRRAVETVEAYGYKTSIISAGEGNIEHPTQMLLDLYTIWERRRKVFESGGLVWAFVGDLPHSRTIKSDILALRHFGGRVYVVSFPDYNLPQDILDAVRLDLEVIKVDNWQEIAGEVDVWYFTRLQKERRKKKPDLKFEKEYVTRYGATLEFRKAIKSDTLITHPLPRGLEIPGRFPPLEDDRIIIDDQVYNGWMTRMAFLSLIAKARSK